MKKEKFYIVSGALKTEIEYLEESLDYISDNSVMWELHPEMDLSEPEVVEDLKHNEHEFIKKQDKYPIHFEIQVSNQGNFVFDNFESIKFSPAGTNEIKGLDDATNEELADLVNGINSRIDYNNLPTGKIHLSYEEAGNDLFLTASSVYVGNEFKFYLTDVNGSDSDDKLGFYSLDEFKERIIELADYENIELQPDELRLREVMIDINDSDYQSLELEHFDNGLPKNHYLQINNHFKDCCFNELYPDSADMPFGKGVEVPELGIKLSNVLESSSVPYEKDKSQEQDLLLDAVDFIKEKQRSEISQEVDTPREKRKSTLRR
ncbi:hypothetical protein [Vibrio sp. 1CM23M]|uniref:hypothetical protein n=1 Tax=Vibrio sp. 1CM23M TaxID=2929164 RepID=UPI0020BF0085|nr:hypothetical protein [Vibrio sp. 1CM23M]MCK8072464.1 hypothetical protein [Vibrio sp. 1CM23M]